MCRIPLSMILLICLLASGHAQEASRQLGVFGGFDLYGGSFGGLDYSLHGQYKHRELEVGNVAYFRDASTTPDGYRQGVTLLTSPPKDKVKGFEVLLGGNRRFEVTPDLRWSAKAGMAFATVSAPDGYKAVDPGWIGSNYTFVYRHSRTTGYVLRTDVEWYGEGMVGGSLGFKYTSLQSQDLIAPNLFMVEARLFVGLFGR